MEDKIITLGELKLNLEELAEFLVWAKKQSYAGGGNYKSVKGYSKQFVCHRGDFYFSDMYKGEAQFAGHETVRSKTKFGQPIWVMNYFGGIWSEFLDNQDIIRRTEDVLKNALMLVTSELPFRGPRHFNNETGDYSNKIAGDIRGFFGDETIELKKLPRNHENQRKLWKNIKDKDILPLYTFTLNYHGGVIIPR